MPVPDLVWELAGETAVAGVLIWAYREVKALLTGQVAILQARLDAQSERHRADLEAERAQCERQIDRLLKLNGK